MTASVNGGKKKICRQHVARQLASSSLFSTPILFSMGMCSSVVMKSQQLHGGHDPASPCTVHVGIVPWPAL